MGRILDFFKRVGKSKERENVVEKEKKEEVPKIESLESAKVINAANAIITKPELMEIFWDWRKYKNGEVAKEDIRPVTEKSEEILNRFLYGENSKQIANNILDSLHSFREKYPNDEILKNYLTLYEIDFRRLNYSTPGDIADDEKLKKYEEIVGSLCSNLRMRERQMDRNLENFIKTEIEYKRIMAEEEEKERRKAEAIEKLNNKKTEHNDGPSL